MSLLISYIIPVYNGAAYLKCCFESLMRIPLQQNEFEIIFVDDLSLDNSAKIISEFANEYSNIRLISHTENKRQGGAKNTGIANALGKYIAFVDQDDTIIPFTDKSFYKQLRECDEDLYSFHFRQEVKPTVWQEKGIDKNEIFVETGQVFCEIYVNPAVSLSPWSYWYKRNYLLELNIKFTEYVMWEDADWVAQYIFYAKSIRYFPLPIYNWHYNVTSISHTLSPFTLADRIFMGYRKYLFARRIETQSTRYSNLMLRDAVWNMGAVKKVWKLEPRDISPFYSRLNFHNIKEISGGLSIQEKLLLQFPILSMLVMIPLSFVYFLLKRLKF